MVLSAWSSRLCWLIAGVGCLYLLLVFGLTSRPAKAMTTQPHQASIYLEQQTISALPGEQVTLDVMIRVGGDPIDIAMAQLQWNPQDLAFVSATNLLGQGQFLYTPTTNPNCTGPDWECMMLLHFTTDPQQPIQLPVDQSQGLHRVTFEVQTTAASATHIQLSENPQDVLVHSLTAAEENIVNMTLSEGLRQVSVLLMDLPSPVPTQTASPLVTPLPSPLATPTPIKMSARLWLDALGPVVTEQPVPIEIGFSTQEEIIGIDVVIGFDPTLVTISELKTANLLDETPKQLVGSDVIHLSQVKVDGIGFKEEGVVAQFLATPKTTNPIPLNFLYTPGSKADSNAISANSGQDTLGGVESLTLVAQANAQIQVVLETASEDLEVGHQLQGTLVHADNAWSQAVTTTREGKSGPYKVPGMIVNQPQSFHFKAPIMLRRRVELVPQSGLNTLILGKLIAGDFNDDGIINSIDLGMMYQQWFGTGTADINRDKTVNTGDYWHLKRHFLAEDE